MTKYKYAYCGQCDGAGRQSDECGPACSECGDADWLEMVEDDISKGMVREDGNFRWTRIGRYAEYPDLRPEGHSIARKMGISVRVERINHVYDTLEIYYLNANEEQIKAIEAAILKEIQEQEQPKGPECGEPECEKYASGQCSGVGFLFCADCEE